MCCPATKALPSRLWVQVRHHYLHTTTLLAQHANFFSLLQRGRPLPGLFAERPSAGCKIKGVSPPINDSRATLHFMM